METASCEIVRLPEDLLAEIIFLTSPLDACRAAAVSRAFRAAADSDAVWSRFVRSDLPPFDDDATELSLSATPLSEKARFMCLSDHPILLPCKRMGVWLDKATGGKCYMLLARALNSRHKPGVWRWIHVDVPHDITSCSISSQAVGLFNASWLDVWGKIQSKMLSQNSTYAVYMVFKLLDRSAGDPFLFQAAFVSRGASNSPRKTCLDGYHEDGVGGAVPVEDDLVLPRRRADGWMELELGVFYNEGEEDDHGHVCFELTELDMNFRKRKCGLVVRSIEVRIKQ